MKRLLVALLAVTMLAVVPTSTAGAVDVLKVGVVDSESSFVNFDQQGWDTGRPPAVLQTVADMGYTVEMLHDAQLTDRATLDAFDVIVLPLTRVMSAEASLTIKDWVEDGGALVAAFIGVRMFARPDCSWTGSIHPRDLGSTAAWTCPTPEHSDGGFGVWVLEMNNEAFEWGPLSEAYQKYFLNDPTPVYTVDDVGSHEIITSTKADLGISTLHFARPEGAGAEFSRLFPGTENVTSLLEFDIAPGTMTVEGVDAGQYDGSTAAQAIKFGKGRIVYFDFSISDFFPEFSATRAAQSHAGTTQGEIALTLFQNSIEWAAAGGTNEAPITRSARTWGEIRIYGDGIYVLQAIENTGNVAVTGDVHARIYDPSGELVYEHIREEVAVSPGDVALEYSQPGYVVTGSLADGNYRVEVEYVYTYPEYAKTHLEAAEVYRSQTGSGDPVITEQVITLDKDVVPRLAGSDRYSTAVEISQDVFSPGVNAVYIATGGDFPDALAGGPAAAAADSPILPVAKDVIPSAIKSELTRLKPKKIVILGGTGAVSEAVEAELKAYTEGPVIRLAGTDRYTTASTISADSFAANVPVVYISTGLNFPDALAGGPVAGISGGPILLVGSTIPGATQTELSRLKPAKIVILGGTGVVNEAVEEELAKFTTGSVIRLAGYDRYSTAAAISASIFGPTTKVVYVATSDNFPDALAGGPAAASADGYGAGPILLVRSDAVPGPTAAELARISPEQIVILGGTGVVTEAVRLELSTYLSS
ncbi:MAG: hypothetical protein HKN07_04070 [Acidimicrobiia bacterium]|nr:hypothetical protein [Acidimicrobiia bacterium]